MRSLADERMQVEEPATVKLPMDWKIAPLGEHLTMAQYGLSVRGQNSGRWPILRMNCQRSGQVHFDNVQFVDLEEAAFEAFRLLPGDLLFNRTNSFELVGRTAIYRGDRETVFASYLLRLRCEARSLCPDFLNFYLNAPETQAELKRLASRGVSQANINATKLKEFLVLIPPKPEQEKIAAILWKIQRAIEVEEKLIATARELKQSAMRQLFTHGLRGEPQKQSEIGPIPQSWHTNTLCGEAHVMMGQSPDGTTYNEIGTGVPLVNGPVEFSPGPLGLTLHTKFTTQPTRFCEPNDLILCVRGSTTGRTNLAASRACIGRGVAAIRARGRNDQGFLNQYLVSIRETIFAMGTGSTFPNVSGEQVRSLTVPVPDVAEQKEIAHILKTIDRKISLHERKRDTLQDLFQTLLHQLMTAEIRVDKLDIDTSEIKGH